MEAWRLFKGVSFGEVSDVRFLPADSDQGIWLVLDRGNHRICVHDEAGRELGQIGRWLPPEMSKRWSLPGCFVGWELDRREVIPHFENFDYLHFPWRLLGHSLTALYIWEPNSRDLKRLRCGQLIPVPYRPEALSEWIGAFDGGLLGWDAQNSRLLLCSLDGKPHAAVVIEGVPVASALSADELWLQAGERLRRIAIDGRGWNRIASGETVDPESLRARPTSEGIDTELVARNLLHFSKALVEFADGVCRLTWPEIISPVVSESTLERLNILYSRSNRVQGEFGRLTHAWSTTVLSHSLGAMAGAVSEENQASAQEVLAQWQRLAERLNCWRWRMVQRSDALFSILERGSLKKALVPESVRELLENVKELLNTHLALDYRFSLDFQQSDGFLQIPCAESSTHEGSSIPLTGAARILPLVRAGLASRHVPIPRLRRPGPIAFTSDGDLWVIDLGEKAVYRHRENERYRIAASQVSSPCALAATRVGMAVADQTGRCVWLIRDDGGCSKVLELSNEEVLAVTCSSGADARYAAAYEPQSGEGRILVLDREWRVTGEIAETGKGRLKIPVDLAVLPDGNLVVVEWGEEAAVLVFSTGGCELSRLFPQPPLPQEWSRVRAAQAGSDGSVFLLDQRYGCVRWYDPRLKYRLMFGRGILREPESLAVREGRLYVSNSGKGEVLEFDLDTPSTHPERRLKMEG